MFDTRLQSIDDTGVLVFKLDFAGASGLFPLLRKRLRERPPDSWMHELDVLAMVRVDFLHGDNLPIARQLCQDDDRVRAGSTRKEPD
jgi:hypothetical protein